jgi:tripartite-type tricarboxylate transporter receptor subunit TctC
MRADHGRATSLVLGLLLVALQTSVGRTQTAADFYQGKTLRIVISTGVAGGFGEYARLLSEHIGRHIAGRPHVIVQSMPGRRRAAGGKLSLRLGAPGRHHHRHHQLDRAVCPVVGQQGRAF